jgi:hypothetical protein
MHLEHNVFSEDMFDTGNLILCLGFRELHRFASAVEYRAIICQLWNICELHSIRRLRFRSSRWWWSGRCPFGSWDANGIQRAWP